MESISLLGVKVNNLSIDEILETIDSFIKNGGSHLIVTLGVEMVMAAQSDKEYRDVINGASLVVPDSVGILWAAKRKGILLKERAPGIEIIERAASESGKFPWRTFFLGASPDVAKTAAEKLKEKYPDFNWVGEHHGYFDKDEEVIRKIREARSEIVYIAMGFPAQEKWFQKNRELLGNIVAIGVGGSFDVLSGSIKRAPTFFRKLGMEWFYRLVTQPGRILRMMALPAFVLKVLIKGV